MKTLALLVIAVALCGCGCQHSPEVQCQPGWLITVNTPEEAKHLRITTGNDLTHTGRVVKVTAPTSIIGIK